MILNRFYSPPSKIYCINILLVEVGRFALPCYISLNVVSGFYGTTKPIVLHERIYIKVRYISFSLYRIISTIELQQLNQLNGVRGATEAGISLIALAIVLQIIFGGTVPFLGGDVVATVIDLVSQLGNAGLVGLIAAALLWKLFDKD